MGLVNEELLKELNRTFQLKLWSWDENQFIYSHVKMIHEEDYLSVIKEFSLFIHGQSKDFNVIYRIVDKDQTHFIQARQEQIEVIDGRIIKVYGSYYDVTELKQKEEELERIAYVDPLTGTYNRLGMSNFIESEFKKNSHQTYAIVFIDLDNFKKVNDIYGHKYGDQTLVNVSKNIMDYLPINCQLSRISGDEFVIFIENFSQFENISLLVDDVLKIIIHSNDRTMSDEATITASAGIALYPIHTDNMSDLLRKADIAMYMAKKSGKARYLYYSKDIEESYLEATQMHRKLLEAFKNNEFGVYYQPIFDLVLNEVKHYELIPFWNHPKKGILISDQFIHTLYEEGLIINFDEWLIERSLKDITYLRNLDKEFKVSVNISPKHLGYPFFVDFVQTKLKQYQVSGKALKIEMVEFILQEDFEALNTNFKELQKLGCEVIINRFAINSSTIAVLNKMHIDTIKINKYFIETLEHEKSSEIIFDTIFKIAKGHNKQFIGDGILNKAQFDLVKDKGCRFVQGDYIQQALPFEQLIKSFK